VLQNAARSSGVHWIAGLDLPLGPALLMYTVARHPGGFAEMIKESREKRRKRSAPPVDDSDDIVLIPALPSIPRSQARADAGDANVLEVDGVTVRFGGLTAVDGASLRVPRGKIVGLIGPNGAGKTTLFNAISGVITPATGTVRLLGQDVSALPAHRRARLGLSRTFQQIGLSKDQTVLENLLLAQHLHTGYGEGPALLYTSRVMHSEEQMNARAREAVQAIGFGGREDVPAKVLSGGQQRILEMACALLTDPELMMLDEPSAGMAPGAVENLATRLRDLRDGLGRTVLLIEHNVPLVVDVCDYIYVLSFGQVLAQGTPDEILADRNVIGAYLGEEVAV